MISTLFSRLTSGVWMMDPIRFQSVLKIAAEKASLSLRDLQAAHAPAGSVNAAIPWDMPGAIPGPSVANGIATIPISGVMDYRVSNFEAWYFGLADTARIQEWITAAANDATVRGIFLDVNSPGGNAQGVPELAQLIADAAQSKPVFAFTDTLMASAAMYSAAPATAIYASPSAIIGSIGTYIAIYDWTAFLESMGIKLELFKSGAYKAAGIAGAPLSDAQRANFQDAVNKHAASFKAFVQSVRPTVADSTMQGQTFQGLEAVPLGLADSLATRAKALADLTTAAGW